MFRVFLIAVLPIFSDCAKPGILTKLARDAFVVEAGVMQEAYLPAFTDDPECACRKDPFNCIKQTLVGMAMDTMKENFELHGELCKEYDFVVIGAGSSGSVIASRLSENPEWKVLLIEAGEGEMLFTDVPLPAAYFQKTDYNWGHRMEYQPGVCLGMLDHRCNWPRGKAVGGTSVINYMIYNRGNKYDYDRLKARGNPGWGYDDVLPFFKKSEKSTLRNSDPGYHGSDGLLSVEDVSFRYPVVHKYLEGAAQLGHKSFIDYNGETQFGFGYVQANTDKGHRCSAARAFLHKQKVRPNLHILTNTRATKIIINPVTKCAEGVEYHRNGEFHTVGVTKEVIVSAGTFHSPQLLMLSGIGPKDHLQEMDIEVIEDLPVGETMYDHICFPGLSFTVNLTHAGLILLYELRPSNVVDWFTKGQGSMAMIGGVESLGFIKTCKSDDPDPVADIELIFSGGCAAADYGTGASRGMDITQEIYDAIYKPVESISTYTVFPMLMHPRSKGYMKLKDNDPLHWPLLYGNYFTDPDNHDIDTMVEGIREIIRISKTPAMQSIGAKLAEIPMPGCTHEEFGTDDYWRCALRHLTATLHHQVGTCKMGPKNDSEAIVDHELRVYGIKNLRVADSSVLPEELTAHTNAPAIMIGEKAAYMIISKWS